MNVGIVSLCYKNYNYGGMLQAYALPKAIEKCGSAAGQICYESGTMAKGGKAEKSYLEKFIEMNMSERKHILIVKLKEALTRTVSKEYKFEERKKVFDEFLKNYIIHDETVYKNDNIHLLDKRYDAFVVGSDQVWNSFISNMNITLMDFAESAKKFSYAASLGKNKLNAEDEKLFGDKLKGFEKISVREKTAKTLLEGITDKTVELVADPVLLLDRNEWDAVANEPNINEKYIFGYFLGNDSSPNKVLNRVKKETGMKLEMIPYTRRIYNFTDKKYADKDLTLTGPREFLGLIKNSEYVVTDSFHAMVFSIIYHKNFIVLDKDKQVAELSTNSRIKDFLKLAGLENRMVDNPSESKVLFEKIKWEKVDEKVEEFKKSSYKFLEEMISSI